MEKITETLITTNRTGVISNRNPGKRISEPCIEIPTQGISIQDLKITNPQVIVIPIRSCEKYVEWFNRYFHLNLRHTKISEVDLDNVVIKRDEYENIYSLIEKNNLTEISDFIFYILFKMQLRQRNAFRNSWHYMSNTIKTIDKDVDSLIRIIDHIAPDVETNNDELLEAYFKIAGERLTINHFLSDIFSFYKDELNNCSMLRNWKKHLLAKKNEFKDLLNSEITLQDRVIINLHKFLTTEGLIRIKSGNLTSDTEIELLTHLVSLAEIYKLREGLDANRKHFGRVIKNHADLIDIKKPENYVFENIDLSVLRRYFDKTLLNLSGTIKPAQICHLAAGVCNRFGIVEITRVREIAHLAHCINIRLNRDNEQTNKLFHQSPILQDFKEFVSAADKKAIQTFSFTSSNQNKQVTISDTKLMKIINETLSYHFQYHKLDQHLDFVEETQSEPGYKHKNIYEMFLPTVCFKLAEYANNHLALESPTYTKEQVLLQFVCRMVMTSDLFCEQPEELVGGLITNWLNAMN